MAFSVKDILTVRVYFNSNHTVGKLLLIPKLKATGSGERGTAFSQQSETGEGLTLNQSGIRA